MVQKKYFFKIKYHLLKFVFGGVLTCFCLCLPKMRLSRKEGKETALTASQRALTACATVLVAAVGMQCL